MAKNYYILSGGRLRRRQNTLYLEKKDGERRALPVNDVLGLYVYGEVDLNSKLLLFLSKNRIPAHFFNYYGFYSGTFFPRRRLVSGFLLVKQVEHYLDKEKRMGIARELVDTSCHNILANLNHYRKHGKNVDEMMTRIETERKAIPQTEGISDLMGTEGRIRDNYYSSFNHILRKGFTLEKRVRAPPDNEVNSLISFGNSLTYAVCLSEIYHTQLDPTISYLHEPSERRFSLALDLSEVFKPLVADRVLFNLVNNRLVDASHFSMELNACYLNDRGRRVFVQEFDRKLKATVLVKKLRRHVSHQRIIRIECFKLIKHLLGEEVYRGFRCGG